jgi:hypothetical protein
MVRHRVVWVISLPLAVASWLGAHCLAYWLVSPGPDQHMGLHAEHGHAYLGYAPAIALLGLALVLSGLLLCVGEGLRGRRPARPPVRLFALLPPVGFAVQEHAERLIGSGTMPYDIVLEPTFLVGLAFQLPFALAALLAASGLHALGFSVGGALAPRLALRRPVRPAPPRAVCPLPASALLVAPCVLALGHGQRAPPTIGCRKH